MTKTLLNTTVREYYKSDNQLQYSEDITAIFNIILKCQYQFKIYVYTDEAVISLMTDLV